MPVPGTMISPGKPRPVSPGGSTAGSASRAGLATKTPQARSPGGRARRPASILVSRYGADGSSLAHPEPGLAASAQRPQRLLDPLVHFGPFECKGEVRFDEALRRAAIECPALEMITEEGLAGLELQHRIGQLDLVAGAPLMVFEDGEYLRLQDVAAVQIEI